MTLLLVLVVLLVGSRPTQTMAQTATPDPLHDPTFEQHLDQMIPFDLVFHDDLDRAVRLGDLFGTKPVILSLGYFTCPMLCPLTREGLLTSIKELDFLLGNEYRIVSLSINPLESSNDAAAQKAVYVQRYGRPVDEQAWTFLTGDQAAIDQLATAIGFRYVYDAETRQYSHPSGVVVVTPQGHISRYIFGIEFPARDLRLALVEASTERIGTIVDQFLLLCYHYDPQTGRYNLLVMNVLRIAAIVTVAIVGAAIYLMTRRDRRTTKPDLPGRAGVPPA